MNYCKKGEDNMATGNRSKTAKKLKGVFDQQALHSRTFEIVEQKEYIVKMYEHGKLIEERSMAGHSKPYAESCGQNWLNGVIRGY